MIILLYYYIIIKRKMNLYIYYIKTLNIYGNKIVHIISVISKYEYEFLFLYALNVK